MWSFVKLFGKRGGKSARSQAAGRAGGGRGVAAGSGPARVEALEGRECFSVAAYNATEAVLTYGYLTHRLTMQQFQLLTMYNYTVNVLGQPAAASSAPATPRVVNQQAAQTITNGWNLLRTNAASFGSYQGSDYFPGSTFDPGSAG